LVWNSSKGLGGWALQSASYLTLTTVKKLILACHTGELKTAFSVPLSLYIPSLCMHTTHGDVPIMIPLLILRHSYRLLVYLCWPIHGWKSKNDALLLIEWWKHTYIQVACARQSKTVCWVYQAHQLEENIIIVP